MTPEQFAEICRLNQEEKDSLLEILNDPEITDWAHQIAEHCFIPEVSGNAPDFPKGDKLSKAWFAAAYFGAEAAKEHYRRQGFPEEVLFETMTDITAWLRNTKRNNGIIGIGYGRSWQAILYHGTVTRHGRLECNTECFYDGPQLTDESGNRVVQKGDALIQIHIPEDGPMDMESCGKSMKRMAEFFAKYRPDYNWTGFHCVSWLLDSQLVPMLSENSNIMKFRNLGYNYPVDIKSDTVYRVFGTTDPFTVENPTSLQRNIVEFLKKGGVFLEGGMFIPRASVEAVDYDLEKLQEQNTRRK